MTLFFWTMGQSVVDASNAVSSQSTCHHLQHCVYLCSSNHSLYHPGSGCKNNPNHCCNGLVCQFQSPYYSQCVPENRDDEEPNTPRPSLRPTQRATNPPTHSPSLRPTAPPVTAPAPEAFNCGCESCTEEVRNQMAGSFSCGERIDWVIANTDLDETDSCILVAGEEYPSICGPCNPATCNVVEPPPPEITPSPTESPTTAPIVIPQDDIEWDGSDLVLTHYWDCSGQSCDAPTLSPWNYDKYRSPSGYQPQDPNDFGGPSVFGEKLWVTAAIMNIDQGSDHGCCGSTSNGGGCGNCILIQNPDSLHPDWTIMAMKKNTCGSCASSPHADINVPGFDNLQYSLANICGESNTGLSKEESSLLGSWYHEYGNVAEAGAAQCDRLPDEYRKGCHLFSEWGWTRGQTIRANYKVVECPSRFREHIGSLFDENGVVEL